MTYVSWATMYEGSSDKLYFDVLIPRMMEEIVAEHGIRSSDIPATAAVSVPRRSVEEVARVACQARDAFYLFFVHADTGGRNLEAELAPRSCAYCNAMNAECDWPLVRCVVIAPRRETEAWILADGAAVTSALGYSGTPRSIGLPATANEAEHLADPKAVLGAAVRNIRGRRRPSDASYIFPAIAQRQSFEELRRAQSFAVFETSLRIALADLGCVNAPAPR